VTTPLPPALGDLETALGLTPGDLDGAEKARALQALDDATTLALDEAPKTVAASWLADGAPPSVGVIVRTAARRGFENPRGLATEKLGEHAVELTDTSGVYLTTREAVRVRYAATGRRGRGSVTSIRTPTAYQESSP